MTRPLATLMGFGAVLLWSALALLTEGAEPVPPLLLTALSFGIGGGALLLWALLSGRGAALRAVPPGALLFATAGLFLYHLLYFWALRLAPAAEAGLVAYLWPLLIVLLAGTLPGERLRPGHLGGAALAFGGVALLASGGFGAGGEGAGLGLGLALLGAITWAGYSVGSRRLGAVPSESVAPACLLVAGLAGLAHLGLEEAAWPAGARGWVSLLLLGLGPVGLAFLLWDVGMKRGDVQLLGVLAYAAPLLSTGLLVASGAAEASWRLGLAAILIAGGAGVAARASRRSPEPPSAAAPGPRAGRARP